MQLSGVGNIPFDLVYLLRLGTLTVIPQFLFLKKKIKKLLIKFLVEQNLKC